jgi:hypothetical protein
MLVKNGVSNYGGEVGENRYKYFEEVGFAQVDNGLQVKIVGEVSKIVGEAQDANVNKIL